MPLRGRGFLAMWFAVADGFGHEFDQWHTIEHMPERLGIPGFLRGRRYRHVREERRFFQLYEGSHVETFRSPGYLARLNAPSDWSNRVQPGMVDFVRGACRSVISLGEGVGGSLLTARFAAAEAGRALADAAPAIARLHGVAAVHVGCHVPDVTRMETAETRLRPAAPAVEFDFVLLVEGIGVAELDAVAAKLPAGQLETDLYRLAYLLDADG